MKVVTVGTSKITETNIHEMKLVGTEVYACVSRDLNRAKNFAYKNNVELYSNNYDRVLRSNEFDFVYIGLPNSLHYEYAKKALENGKTLLLKSQYVLIKKKQGNLFL